MSAASARRTIGGEWEIGSLAFGDVQSLIEMTAGAAGTWTASGRAALTIVLRRLQGQGVRHVQLPAYICESVVRAVQAVPLTYSFYPVDEDLSAHPDPAPNAAVLLIHYFGWVNPATVALRGEAGRSFELVEDASQAVLSDWRGQAAKPGWAFFSARKLGPVPLGGWCSVQVELEEPSAQVEALTWRSLAARLARGWYLAEPDAPIDPRVEEFYLDAFEAVETFLDRHPTYAPVPRLALDLIAGVDWKAAAAARRANWRTLHDLLGECVTPLSRALPDGVVPLGYPVTLRQRDTIRARLASQRIFCPVQWRLPAEVEPSRFPVAARLAETSLTLPLDQRYSPEEMARLAAVLEACL